MDDTLYDGTGLPPAGETEPEASSLTVPAGSTEDRVEWVSQGADSDERRARADAVWAHEVETSDGATDLDELGRLLTYHVYREQNQAAVVLDGGAQEPPGLPASPDGAEPGDPATVNPQTDGDGTSYEDAAPSGPAAETVTDGNEAVAVPSAEIPGELVESDTAGTGGAVNAETGAVTAPGEPLPTIETTGGDPLEAPAVPEEQTPTEASTPDAPQTT